MTTDGISQSITADLSCLIDGEYASSWGLESLADCLTSIVWQYSVTGGDSWEDLPDTQENVISAVNTIQFRVLATWKMISVVVVTEVPENISDANTRANALSNADYITSTGNYRNTLFRIIYILLLLVLMKITKL